MTKKKWLDVLDWIGCIFPMLLCIYVMGLMWSGPIMALLLATNPENIQSNGCLTYSHAGKYKEAIVFINDKKTARSVGKATLDRFPFAKKMEQGLIPGELKDYKNTCLKIKYIHVDPWIWGSGDYVYDLDE